MRKLKNDELSRKSPEEFKHAVKSPFIVVLDNVRSLMNIGSIFRTSDAFMAEAVYLCGISGIPPNNEITKTALGATESVAWKYYKSSKEAVRELKEKGFVILSVEQVEESISLKDFQIDFNKKYAIVFGHEIKGVDQCIIDLSDYCIEIPQFGTKHSFNVAVSTGIVLWELYNKLIALK